MATVTLGSKAVGSIVKLRVSGTLRNFIVVHQGRPSSIYDASCDGTWLLMEDVYVNRAWHSTNVNDYANSTIHSYLNSTWINLLDENIRNAIKQVKIPYRAGSGYAKTVTSGANGLSTKAFLLSSYEMGWTSSDNSYLPEDGAKLAYFDPGTDTTANNKRIGKLNGTATICWLRSPYCYSGNGAKRASYANKNGTLGSDDCSNAHGIWPAFVLPPTCFVSDDGSVFVNTAPSMPASITVPASIQGGTSVTVSWGKSTDAESNLEGYELERSTNSGSSWSNIYRGSGTSTTNTVPYGTQSVVYRVRAYDSEGLESGWKISSQVTVINNTAPGAPPSITVPVTVTGGGTLVISWTKSTDAEGNLSGYILERQVGSGTWTQVYKGAALTYTDSITKGWTSVTYRVRAYDSYNAESANTVSPTRTVDNNSAPVITCDTPSGADLGTKAKGFTVNYSVGDVDADAVTVTEAFDGVAKRTFQAKLGQNYAFEVTGDTFMRVLNGKHTMTITANDGQASTVHKLTFTKEVTAASITLETPMDADAEITLAVLSVVGNIPADAAYKVEVTNNGKDAQPVWQDATAAVRSGTNIIFKNHTASNGFAFNFRIKVERGSSGVGGYISSVQGGFQ